MSWVAAAAAAVGMAMQIGSNFTKDEGTKQGLSMGGKLVGLAGGGMGAAGSAAGGAMSEGSSMLPGIFSAAPQATSSMAPSMMASNPTFSLMPQGGSALQEAIQLAQAGGLSGGPGMKPPAPPMTMPQAPNQVGPITQPAPAAPGQIPPVEAVPAWKQALAAGATAQDMMLKQQAASRVPNAPSPNFYIPGQVAKPKLSAGLASSGTLSPMQRFAALLRG